MPSGVNVGGVNVAIGVDTSRVVEGLADAKKNLTEYVNTINSKFNKLNLEGAIKGNPFAATSKYLKTTSSQLNEMFGSWSDNINKTTDVVGKFATKAKENFERVSKAYDATLGKIAGKARGGSESTAAGTSLAATIQKSISLDELKGIAAALEVLEQVVPGRG